MKTSPGNTIGILTGGGDVPGLNPCIKQLVVRAHQLGMSVLGIRRGWDGLVGFSPDDPDSRVRNIIPLDPACVRTIDRSGGTILHTSRTNPAAVSYKDAPIFLKDRFASKMEKRDLTGHVLDNLSNLGIDALVAIGGDDTLSFALRLHREGFPVIAIPKTMDNDVTGTDYCIGFSTAITRSVNFIHALRTSSGSHERIAVVELFGRYCGETSLVSAYLAGVERCVISEVPFNINTLCNFLVADRQNNPSGYAMMTISEGAVMQGGEIRAAVRGRPQGESLMRVEQPRGEVVYYIRADGGKTLSRVRIRTPTFANIPVLVKLLPGIFLSDVPVVVLSIDPCISCLER